MTEQRVREIYRMNKRQLAAFYREHSNMIWSAVPPEKWSKDELVNEVLRLERDAAESA